MFEPIKQEIKEVEFDNQKNIIMQLLMNFGK